jgi:hypothetical protein
VRFDTYEGCSHNCTYCFVKRKSALNVKPGESVAALKRWIKGDRPLGLKWCDWNIPLHWGGMSDPFQPAELTQRRSLDCLKVFAETQYPFIVSTKSKIVAQEPYFSLIKMCDCIVQFSAVCEKFDNWERGASPFLERIEAARKIAEYKRVMIRIQPYHPAVFRDVLAVIPKYAQAGIYGVVVEGMKYTAPPKGYSLCRVGNDFCFPLSILKPQYEVIKATCHEHGLKFFSGENRLRAMGDGLCCCGAEGMGWQLNTANLNHYLYDKKGYKFTKGQRTESMGNLGQTTIQGTFLRTHSYEDAMRIYESSSAANALKPVGFISLAVSDEDITGDLKDIHAFFQRAIKQWANKKEGRTQKYLCEKCGNFMPGHYFAKKTQWCIPTERDYLILQKELPLLAAMPYSDLIKWLKEARLAGARRQAKGATITA